MSTAKDPRSGAIAFGGAALIALGLWLFVQNSGLLPAYVLDIINRTSGAVTLIILGVIVILLSRRHAFTTERSATRFYRSRTDKMLGGVLGGLGPYIGIDPLVLRVVIALLAVVGSATFLVVIYIVLWIVVPEEPLMATEIPIPPAPPIPGA